METSKVQAIISIIVVAGFVIFTGILGIVPVLADLELPGYTEHLKTFASIYSGITGLIIGYYFGRGKTGK